MSHDHGAYGDADATEEQKTTPAAGASTDATLEGRAKSPNQHHGPKAWVWALVAAIAVVAIVIGATVFGRKSDDGASGSGQTADTVTIGLKLAPTNLDIRNQSGSALDQLLIGNVYEGLVGRDSDNQVVPAIAKSWKVSDDGLTYTFALNENMSFSNGDALTAEDVAWSINELIDQQYHDADALDGVTSVTADGENTVVITLEAPNSNLLWTLTGRPGLVFDKDADYDAKTEAVGSGPYTVSKFVANDSVTLTANENYWGEHTAKTPTVVVKYYNDDNAAVNALKSGDVQVLAPITENLAEPFASDSEHYTVQAGDGTDKYVLAFNSKGEKTSDQRVRQAIRYAIDHDELIASRGGADTALGGPIPSLDPGYEDLTDLYPHDVDKAKELLAEAGYSTDHPLELTLTYANTYGTELGDQLRSQLKEVGIELTVNVVEFSTWLQDVYTNHDYDLSLVDHNESHDFYQWADPDYYYGYDNAEVQRLYAEGVAATSDEERDAKFAQAAALVSQDAPADWLFNYRITTAMVNGVEGFPFNMNQTLLPLYDVTYTE
ncbi:ABC transporter substrate-binding protein [Bifidobacterium eulemuris]|uniref:ABC transporter substrate-binding protein n=1 Tax=Bifidobacterium eulemuris TaxID=1765219 RepID=A0A261G9K9_9BIFI|nr:ABC transporter substrate-binding protein [Bifidobacterium eulemuris]OZG68098.1 ABC transporter substrate-binding protein [Bifidobacterium eulemuris]QOL31835.1 ABC transporter substrate-binding protein [Bifidobacterium eulemuris]